MVTTGDLTTISSISAVACEEDMTITINTNDVIARCEHGKWVRVESEPCQKLPRVIDQGMPIEQP
jgi:hypothetical protein